MMRDVIVSVAWLLRAARIGFGLWLLIYGLASLLSPSSKLPVSALADVSMLLNLKLNYLQSAVFLIPGVLIIPKLTRTVGLSIAVGTLSIFEVGLIASAVNGPGTYTAPVTFGFAVAAAAFLISVREVE